MTVLFVLLTLVMFLTADHFIQRARARATAKVYARSMQGVPADVALALNHTWVRHEADGIATVGLDELLGKLIGSVERIVMPNAGDAFTAARGEITLKHGAKSLPVAVPVTGRIVAVNNDLLKDPSLLAADPYGKGWMMKVKVDRQHAPKTLIGPEAAEWLSTQMGLVKEFLWSKNPQAAVAMQDGGVVADGALKSFEQEVWNEFSKRFVALHPNAQ